MYSCFYTQLIGILWTCLWTPICVAHGFKPAAKLQAPRESIRKINVCIRLSFAGLGRRWSKHSSSLQKAPKVLAHGFKPAAKLQAPRNSIRKINVCIRLSFPGNLIVVPRLFNFKYLQNSAIKTACYAVSSNFAHVP